MIPNDPPLPFLACPHVKKICLAQRELSLERVWIGRPNFFNSLIKRKRVHAEVDEFWHVLFDDSSFNCKKRCVGIDTQIGTRLQENTNKVPQLLLNSVLPAKVVITNQNATRFFRITNLLSPVWKTKDLIK